MVDPLGLNSCNFNIALVNLTGQDSSGVESQIEALFAASSAGQPSSVGFNFQLSGNAAVTVYITDNGKPGEPDGYCQSSVAAELEINTDRIRLSRRRRCKERFNLRQQPRSNLG